MEITRGMSIRLEGNTDFVGDKAVNQRLSELRAQSILEYLVSRGVPRERMVAKGNGATNPVASNTTFEGRAKNRRTDVLFIKGQTAAP
jgi:outer membrane protein OmpA-like peptidoglycan-associated protein